MNPRPFPIYNRDTVGPINQKNYMTLLRAKYGDYFTFYFDAPPPALHPRDRSKARVEIGCPIHGRVSADAYTLVCSQYGCPACAKQTRTAVIHAARPDWLTRQKRTLEFGSLQVLTGRKRTGGQKSFRPVSKKSNPGSLEMVREQHRLFGPERIYTPTMRQEDRYQYEGWLAGRIRNPQIMRGTRWHKEYMQTRHHVETQRSAQHETIPHIPRSEPSPPPGLHTAVHRNPDHRAVDILLSA